MIKLKKELEEIITYIEPYKYIGDNVAISLEEEEDGVWLVCYSKTHVSKIPIRDGSYESIKKFEIYLFKYIVEWISQRANDNIGSKSISKVTMVDGVVKCTSQRLRFGERTIGPRKTYLISNKVELEEFAKGIDEILRGRLSE